MPRHYRKSIVIVLILFLFFGLLNQFVFRNFIQNGAYASSKKIGEYFNGFFLRVGNFGRIFINLSAIIEKNRELSEQNAKLISTETALNKSERENDLLRNQLKIGARGKHTLIEAKIFSINRNLLSSTLLINRGEKDGIKKNMAVVASGNVLLGSISEVYERSALVLLLDDARSLVSVKLVTDVSAEIVGSARGGGSAGGVINIDLVTNQEEVRENDLVVTSGLDNFPEALVVGKISSSQLKGGNLFKTIQAKLDFDPILDPLVFIIAP